MSKRLKCYSCYYQCSFEVNFELTDNRLPVSVVIFYTEVIFCSAVVAKFAAVITVVDFGYYVPHHVQSGGTKLKT